MTAPAPNLVLVRLVTATFTPKPAGDLDWAIVDGDIEIRPVRAFDTPDSLKLLVSAAVPLRYCPKVTRSHEVVIPTREREACERALERAVNTVSVGYGCRRLIASPWPCAVLIATTESAKDWLAARRGVHHAKLKMAATRTRDRMKLDPNTLNQLSDRDDGVALMAEALAAGHATARFHEFVRLFERAFAKPSKKLVDPLTAFLAPRFGYSESELNTWFLELRDPATHADARRKFALEVDVRPVIDRMEQAAYDVLLNKATWRDTSTDRRAVWTPTSGTTSAAGDAFIVQHTTPVTQASILDEYGAFPMDMAAVINPRPANWWPQLDSPSSETEPFKIEIVPAASDSRNET